MCVYLQAWKCSYFATLPQFLNLTTSKTKGFCETSSILELNTIQNEAIQRDVLNFWIWQHQKRSNSARLPQIWKAECRADGLVPMRFAIFPLHLSKVLRLPRKSNARLYEVHLSGKIIFPKLKIWCSKMQPLSGNQRPHLLTSLMNMSLVLRLPRKMHLCRSSSNAPRLPLFLEMLQNPHLLLTFDKVHSPLRLPRKTTSERPNVQKCSKLRATTACTFSTSQLPKVLRGWGVLYMLTWKRASRHNGVQFFISHLASWLRTRRFREPTFRPSGATNHWKNTLFRAPGSSFFGDFLFLIFFLLFSDSYHLCFSSVHIVGSLTSKLLSMT